MTVTPTSLRRELLLSFGLLLGAAILIAAAVIAGVLPMVTSPAQAVALIVTLLGLDLIVILLVARRLLQRLFVGPVERMLQDAERIAQGAHDHRIGPMPAAELEAIRTSVNSLADRLVHEKERLAGNVRSLDRTNAELVSTRNELIQTARLASVGSLASGIAHEVGNPLGALMGFAELACMKAERENRDTDLLQAIRGEAKRIDRIIRTLLQYARGHSQVEAGPVEVSGVMARVSDLLASQGRLSVVELEWSEGDDVPPVFGHAQQVEQVLVNLTLNAIDALDGVDEPRITVSVECEKGGFLRLPVRRDQDQDAVDYTHRRRVATDQEVGGPDSLFTASRIVVVRIRDNGLGIADENLDRVFDPFFTTKDPGKGTGLGLAICARLIEGMGGRIRARNAEEGGAEFVIRLPAADRRATTP